MLVRILGLYLLLASPVLAAPGDLDPTFGFRGDVDREVFPGDSFGMSLVAEPDDRLVVASSVPPSSLAVVRYLESGALDPSFGTGGIVAMPIASGAGGVVEVPILSGSTIFVGLARQGDGKFLVGTTTPGVGSSTDLLVARLGANGTVDASFGSGGTAIVDADTEEGMRALLLQTDGKVVIAGTTGAAVLARLDSSGMPDPGFGTEGIVRTDVAGPPSFSSGIQGLAQQADGKLVAVGYAGFDTGRDVAVVRYETDGSLDPTFGAGGIVILPMSATEQDDATSVAIQPDGKIVVAGAVGLPFLDSRLFVARLDETGSLDPDFATGGIFELERSVAFSVLVDAAGRVVVTGGQLFDPFYFFARTLVLRLLGDGTLDPTFGDGGVVLHQRYPPRLPATEVMLDIVEDSRGRLVTAGVANRFIIDNPDPYHVALSRFLVGYCGNGQLESDEDCDDGNLQGGDCCSSACHFDAQGSACEGTGDLCTLPQCDGAGTCLTPFTPDPTCRESLGPTLGRLRIASPADPNRRKLRWSWLNGVTQFSGNPLDDTDLSFCMYDGTGELVSRLDVPGGAMCADGPCWSFSGQSFFYRDSSRERGGLGLLRLTAGYAADRVAVTFLAKGAEVPVPSLPLAAPIEVQLRASNGECWGVTFDADSIQRNGDTRFGARAK